MSLVNVDIEYKTFEKQLGKFKYKMPYIGKSMMSKVNTQIKKDTRKVLRSRGYSRKEDGILKNLFSTAKKDFTAVVGIKRVAFYQSFVERGQKPKAKNQKYLCFKINGEFRKVKSVTIPARPFLKPVIDNYYNTTKAKKIMDEVFQKRLDKIFGD